MQPEVSKLAFEMKRLVFFEERVQNGESDLD
jgi:hypothetical protein